jgi:DNA-binding MarR family transcriptional regulator
MGKRLLTVNEKILLFLKEQEGRMEVAPSQKKIAQDLELQRNHVSRGLAFLLSNALVEETKSHVKGELRVMKTYLLTGKGRKLLKEVVDRVMEEEIKVKHGGKSKTVKIKELDDKDSMRIGILGIAAQVESKGVLDLDKENAAAKPPEKSVFIHHGLRPPERFVGRDKEIEDLKDAISSGRKKLVLVHGPKGIGKSAMCATIAKDLSSDMNVYWYTGSEYEDVTDLLRTLSGFMEAIGRLSLRTYYMRLDEIDLGEALSLLKENMDGTNSVLVLDGLSELKEDIATMAKRIISALYGTKGVFIIITARGMDALADQKEYFTEEAALELELKGLDRDSSRELLSKRVEGQEFDRLYELTEGNPLIMMLAGTQSVEDDDGTFSPDELALVKYVKVIKKD